MSWVGAICGAGLAEAEPVVTGAAACTSAGFGAGAAACWIGAGTGAGLAASGFAFGIGTVLSVEALDDDTKLVVRFVNIGQKTLRAKFARLEPA